MPATWWQGTSVLVFREILGITVFGLLHNHWVSNVVLYLYLVSFAYWLPSLYVLLSGALSATGTVLPTTLFFFVFHACGFLLYLAGGIGVLVVVAKYQWAQAIAAAVLGLFASVAHLVHAILFYKSN
ncbi:uncharacterized protein LOC135377674 isoform X2 [Ornithodoros turicata]|uniref:uncharacterized protein LOC135377674 isoform X2 n=1 Tax=Ornithodoros turicata TaxID=34597 RepID=UPI003139781E